MKTMLLVLWGFFFITPSFAATGHCTGVVAESFYWGEFGERREVYSAEAEIENEQPQNLSLTLMVGTKSSGKVKYEAVGYKQSRCLEIDFRAAAPSNRFPSSLLGSFCHGRLSLTDGIDTGPMAVSGSRKLINHLDCVLK